jgi:hypothetical protein
MTWPAVAVKRTKGHRWQRFRQLVFATYGNCCILCLHGGARTVDHLEPFTEHPEKEMDLANCRPIHSAPYNRCPVCVALMGPTAGNCNGMKGGYGIDRARRIFAERMAAAGKAPSPPKPEKPADTGRDF